MFYDLCLLCPELESDLRDHLAAAAALGYHAVAVTNVVSEALTDRHRCRFKPVPADALAAASPEASAALRRCQGLVWKPAATRQLLQLSRLLLVTDDVNVAQGLARPASPIARSYDLLSIRPGSERVLAAACSGNLEVDIISIDLSRGRLPFRLRPAQLRSALARGVALEVTLAPTLLAGGGAARQAAFASGPVLARATGGRGIIVSSGASHPGQLRSPGDAATLLMLMLGGASGGGPGCNRGGGGALLHSSRALEAVGAGAQRVVDRAQLRRSFYKGALRVEHGPAAIGGWAEEEEEEQEEGGEERGGGGADAVAMEVEAEGSDGGGGGRGGAKRKRW